MNRYYGNGLSGTIASLGTASLYSSTAFATAAQGTKADSALQDASAFATAAQGLKADSAIQSLNIGTTAGKTVALDGNAKLPAVDGSQLTNLPQVGLGVGQTWTDVTASRAFDTTYTNSTGKPIMVSVWGNSTSASGGVLEFLINGVKISEQGANYNSSIVTHPSTTIIIPNGSTYLAKSLSGGGLFGSLGLQKWMELR